MEETGDTTGRAIEAYLDMGGYAAYVWPAYGIAAVALCGLLIWSVLRTRALERRVGDQRRAMPANEEFQ